jgi:hypothetical protein
MKHPRNRFWLTNGACAAVLALALAASAHPVAAQALEQACADTKAQHDYLIANDVIVQAGLRNGVDLRAQNDMMLKAYCGQSGDAPPSKPTQNDPPADPGSPCTAQTRATDQILVLRDMANLRLEVAKQSADALPAEAADEEARRQGQHVPSMPSPFKQPKCLQTPTAENSLLTLAQQAASRVL